MEKTIKSDQMNNDIIQQVLNSTVQEEPQIVELTNPSDTLVHLPAGYIMPDGEVAKTAEVRELTGKDEELIGKTNGGFSALFTVLRQAVVKIGEVPATDAILDSLLIGDRDALLLGIYKATFGVEVEIPGLCASCGEFKTVAVDLNRDVNTKVLVDPILDRKFTVKGRQKEFLVTLPTGAVQKNLVSISENNPGERNTVLLQNTVLEIDGKPVLGKVQIQNLGVMDRNKIASEIGSRLPGPQFEDITLECPDCQGEVVVPFSLGALFRF